MLKKIVTLLVLFSVATLAYAEAKIVNVYAWTAEIPDFVIRKFEKETGIKVNISTYENNEIMYTKLRAIKNPGYDVIMPSSYFVDRMRKQNLLESLDKSKLSNWKNLHPEFLHPAYDPKAEFSVPFIWGITGIFVNKNYFSTESVNEWKDLWDERFYNQLMLLDDSREVFSMALLALGYSPNDKNPEHIKQAFLKLKALAGNIKVFSSDTVISIMIDEDATVGMGWNGDVFRSSQENPNVKFIFPKEGYVLWVDTFAIPKSAPHKDTAYQFINFIMRADIAKEIALTTNFPTANKVAQDHLPANIKNNPTVYPPPAIMQKAQFQTDLGEETLALYEQYWEELKMFLG